MLTDRYLNQPQNGCAELVIIDSKTDMEKFVPLCSTELQGEILGTLLHADILHTFYLPKGKRSKAIEAVYRFPLPGDAAVLGVSVKFGDFVIETNLLPIDQAKEEYQQAVEENRQAALIQQEKADVFTMSIAGIRAGETVEVTTSFVQVAERKTKGWRIRVPLTIAPKFTRYDEENANRKNPLAIAIDPGHRFSLSLDASGIHGVSSPTHAIGIAEAGDEAHICLREETVIPDRDFILDWVTGGTSMEGAFSVMGHYDPQKQELHALLTVTPPLTGETHDRELILMVDLSGSMAWEKWEASKTVVRNCLNQMRSSEYFNLVLFNDKTYLFRHHSVLATAENIETAVMFLENEPYGGTELGVALERVLHMQRADCQLCANILLITDAQVTDEDRILFLVDEETLADHPRKISIICIDSAPNSFFAKEIARRGNGFCEFVCSGVEGGELAETIENAMEALSRPSWKNVSLIVDKSEVWSTEVVLERTENTLIQLGDLIPGRSKIVPVSLQTAKSVLFTFEDGEGKTLGNVMFRPQADRSREGIRALVGGCRVRLLESLYYNTCMGDEVAASYGYSLGLEEEGGVGTSIYPENRHADRLATFNRLICQESLKYGIMSMMTGFIAVRKDVRTGKSETYCVANALPKGWTPNLSAVVEYACSASCSGIWGLVYELDMQPNSKAHMLEIIDNRLLKQGEPCEFSFEVPCNIAICEVMIGGFKKSMRGHLLLFADDAETPNANINLKKLLDWGNYMVQIHGCKGLVRAVVFIEQGIKIPEDFSISIRYYQLDEIINN